MGFYISQGDTLKVHSLPGILLKIFTQFYPLLANSELVMSIELIIRRVPSARLN